VTSGLTARDVGVALSVGLYLLCVAGVGYRIFDGGGHLEPTLWLIIVSQGVFLVAQALRLRRGIGAMLSGIGLVIALTHHHAPASHWYGLPTARTWTIWTETISESTAMFSTTTAPVPYDTGWAGLFGLGVALVVITTLILGQVLRAHFQALIPGATFFIFLSVLGDGSSPVTLTLAVITSGYLMATTLRGAAHLTVARLVFAGVTVALIGVAAAPYLPGADEEALITTRGRFGTSNTALSPLVDIQARLVNQSTVEMFEMESTQPAYWRLLTLPEFDGRRFSAPTIPRDPTSPGEVATALARIDVDLRLDQVLKISGLEGNLLPAAVVPVAVSTTDGGGPPQGSELRWNADISAVVRADRDLLSNDTFLVQSVLPKIQASQLLGRQALSPPDSIYVSLPESFPQAVIDKAAEVVESATGLIAPSGAPLGANYPYLVALALQDWFRTEFTYSLEIPSGHGNSALERFLENRVGYCEQFAASFVAMARSQGLASRVAVGYTPGIQRQPGRYTVQGRHAHAWPEVWFDGIGWVPFEPTPGRGVPGAEDYTGLFAQQDGPLSVVEPNPEDAAGFEALDEIANLNDSDFDIAEGDSSEVPVDDDAPLVATKDLFRSARGITLLGLIGMAVAGPWLWRRIRSHRSQRLPPDEQILAIWGSQLRALRHDGITPAHAMSVTDIRRVAQQRIPALKEPLDGLATHAMTAGFSRDPRIDPADLEQCATWSKEITRLLARRKGVVARIAAYFAIWRDRPTKSHQGGSYPTVVNREGQNLADGVSDPSDQNSGRPLARR